MEAREKSATRPRGGERGGGRGWGEAEVGIQVSIPAYLCLEITSPAWPYLRIQVQAGQVNVWRGNIPGIVISIAGCVPRNGCVGHNVATIVGVQL